MVISNNIDNGQVISYIEDPENNVHCIITSSKIIY